MKMKTNRGKASLSAPASLTIECAMILPLFLMAVITLLTLLDITGKCAKSSLELSNKARQAATYSCVIDEGPEWVELSDLITYSPPFASIPALKITFCQKARVRRWIGAEEGMFLDGGETPKTVYVTDYESVYHTDINCTHIDLSVMKTDLSSVDNLRNIYGKKYKKCTGFPKGYEGPVYITAKGDRYYPSPDFAGLTRNVHITTMDEVSHLHICSRCSHAA